jgi:undecaprenyl-diphosphatase
MIEHLLSRLLSPTARALLPGLILSAAGLFAFIAVLDQFLERDDIYLADQPVLEALADVRTPWLTTVLTGVTNAFGPVVLPLVVGALCLVWARVTRAWRDPALLLGAMVASTAIAVVVKLLVSRPRPEEDLQVIPGLETSFSFPSGHTTGAATLVLVVAYLVWRHRKRTRELMAWAAASVGIVILVGGSRLYLGYHFVTDVMAGACLGVVTLGMVVATSRWLDLRQATQAGSSPP